MFLNVDKTDGFIIHVLFEFGYFYDTIFIILVRPKLYFTAQVFGKVQVTHANTFTSCMQTQDTSKIKVAINELNKKDSGFNG